MDEPTHRENMDERRERDGMAQFMKHEQRSEAERGPLGDKIIIAIFLPSLTHVSPATECYAPGD